MASAGLYDMVDVLVTPRLNDLRRYQELSLGNGRIALGPPHLLVARPPSREKGPPQARAYGGICISGGAARTDVCWRLTLHGGT